MKRTWAYAIALLGGYIFTACGGAGGGSGGGSACGNGKVDGPTESCDGTDYKGQTCKSLKFEAGTLGCSDKCVVDIKGCCVSKCANVGDTTCQGNQLKTCTMQPTGCRDYTVTNDCAATGKVCDTSTGKAQCKASCTDACALAGAKQCNGAVVETCTMGTDGCRDWVATEDCAASGQNCDAISSAAHCTTECVNQCPTAGDTQCNGTIIQTCTSAGGSCNSWVTTQDCAGQGKSCVLNGTTATCGVSCNNKCNSEGTQTCLTNVLSTCTADANGCLDWAATQDCTTTNTYCKLAGAGLAKCEPVCLDPCVTVGEKKCNANVIQSCTQDPNGCKEWKSSTTCPTGQTCDPSTFTCVTAPPTGEDCGTAIVVKGGANTVNWTATTNNYLTTTLKPSCVTYTISGGDVVLSYTAPITGIVDLSITKPTSNYQIVTVSSSACGTPATGNLFCQQSNYSNTTMGGTFNVVQGSTYFIYVADTTNYAAPLNNPLSVNLTEINCASFGATASTLSPANGSTTTTLSPKLTADFDTDLKTNVGTINIVGNKGTNITYNLANVPAPTQVTWTNSNKTININPGIAFPAGEIVTVTFTGMVDNKCGNAINKPTWSFTILTPPCSPGVGGMVGNTLTKQATGLPISSEYFMGTDTSATGYVYVGGSSELWRVQKTSPTTLTSVHSLAGLSSTHLGYSMIMDGSNIFTLNDTSSTTQRLWRISLDGGANWISPLQDFASWTTTPADYTYAGVGYKGKVYMVTRETSTSIGTQVWSVSSTPPTVPGAATLETTVAVGEAYCTGIAMDDTNYYLTCGTSDRLVRVTRSTGAVTLISTSSDLDNYYSNPIFANDTNGDGTADYLYFKGGTKEIFFVCNPSSATPYVDRLASWGTTTSTSNYGLAFDATNKVLYAFDESTKELITVK